MRKKISEQVALALLAGTMIIGSSCSKNWIAEARDILAVLIPAATNLVTLVAALQGKGASPADLSTIETGGTQAAADLQVIEALIRAYESAEQTAKPGILNQIQSAIGAAQGNLQGLMLGLRIKDVATRAKILAIVGLLQSELQSLATLVPIVQGEGAGVRSEAALARISGRTKAPLRANEFVKSYNSVMAARTGNAALDRATAGIAIHLHSRMQRVASAGVLQ
jgi:hypothetical protein